MTKPDVRVRMTDSSGRVIKSLPTFRGEFLTIDLADIPGGVYWIQLEDTAHVIQETFVKVQ